MITKEAIEAAKKAAPQFWRDTDNFERNVSKILTAAFAAMPGPAVRVKPLEWVDTPEFMGDDEVNYSEAVGAGYTYIAEAIDCALDEAKAASQAAYEANILSALTPAPDLASENERLREYYEAREAVAKVGMLNATEDQLARIISAREAIAALERT